MNYSEQPPASLNGSDTTSPPEGAIVESIVPEAPRPLSREIPPGEIYPVEGLGPLQSVVEAVHDKTQAPIAIAAQSALAVVSLAVQGFADIETLGGPAPCSLYCLTVAQSGERKSGCDRLLMKAVREHEADAMQAYKVDYAKYDIEHKIWEGKRAGLLKGTASPKGDVAMNARADLVDYPLAPEPPLSPNRTATDPTYEGIVKLFANSQPSLGIFTDEGGAFLGGHAMNSDNRLKTCAGLSGLWDGTPINRTRAGDGASTFPGRRFTSHLMVQPIVARPLLADPVASAQGFLARYLMCEPESTIGFRLKHGCKPASDTNIATFGARLRQMLETPLPLREGTRNELEPRSLALSGGAKLLLQRYYDSTERAQAPDGDLSHVRPYASKSAEQAARIAGVLTLWETPKATEVTPETMAQGITLAQFYLSESRRLADTAVVSAGIERAERLKKWLLEKWGKQYVLPTNIIQNGPSPLRESPLVENAISILEQHGWLVKLPPGTVTEGKARKVAYRIVRPPNVA